MTTAPVNPTIPPQYQQPVPGLPVPVQQPIKSLFQQPAQVVPQVQVVQPIAQPQPLAAGQTPNLFGALKDAQPSFGSNYIRPSHALWRINKIKVDISRKNEGFLAVEMTCLEDLAPTQYSQGLYGHLEGEEATHMMMQKFDSFLPNVKAFIANTMGINPDEIGQEQALLICAPNQPLQNTVVEIFAKQIMTKRSTPFTHVDYKGEVRPSVLLERWGATEEGLAKIQRFFPNNLLQQMAQADAQGQPVVQPPVAQQPVQQPVQQFVQQPVQPVQYVQPVQQPMTQPQVVGQGVPVGHDGIPF